MPRRVLVLGSGVIGLCVAYYAARRGWQVTVVDRRAAQRDGCSFGNAGMIVPSHFTPLAAPGMMALGLKWMWSKESPFAIKLRWNAELFDWVWKFWRAATPDHVREAAPLLRDLHLASRVCYEELAGTLADDFGLVRKGLLMLCKSQHALGEESALAEQAQALGISAQRLDARRTAELEPALRMDVAGSIYFPMDCHLTPHRFMDSLQRRLDGMGVQWLWNSEATRWRVRGTKVETLITAQGEMTADEYVLCGGAWSAETIRDLDLTLPLQAGKGYSLTLPKPRRLPQICAILTEARVAMTPMGETLRFGGTMEIAGLNEKINPHRIQGIIKAVPNYFPEFQREDFEGIQPWCGLRPCSPDGLPYVGRMAPYGNLVVATGHAMMGLSLGPITGKLVSELLDGESPSIRLEGLAPDRFAKRR